MPPIQQLCCSVDSLIPVAAEIRNKPWRNVASQGWRSLHTTSESAAMEALVITSEGIMSI